MKVEFPFDTVADGKGKWSRHVKKMLVNSPKQRNSVDLSVRIAGQIVLLRYAFEEVKDKVNRMVTKCPFVMDRLVTCVDLNVLPP